ncbi:MAG: hypothetical protein H7Z16_02520 [Pyrinomonadaceae bacterium]|nr:hypothetical protein [Pyrinomonadaceae bacterium]
MSKQISLFLPARLAAILALSSLVVGISDGAHAPQRSRALKREVATNASRNAAIVATTSAVLKETSEIRELAILRPVRSGAESRADIERMLVRNLDKQRTPAEMHATELSLRKFGLAPSEFKYRPFIIKLLTEQVAGYYDTKEQRFRLADWLDLEGQKPVMAHELTHALQDQHFNLKRFEKWPRGDSDAEIAAHALIEGDATLAMTMYMLKYPMVALAFTKSLAAGGISTEQYDLAPRAIRESLIFPYLNGSQWATQVYKRGGWAAVSKAYTNLPLSTEQIIHSEKYFSYERPIKVALPDVTNLLSAGTGVSNQQSAISKQPSPISNSPFPGTAGVPPAPRTRSSKSGAIASRPLPPPRKLPTAHRPLPNDAWHRIESDVNGEWSYYLILDQFLNSPSESKRAAAGWGGDRYELYEGPGGQVFLAQLTAWDTDDDASEFFDAYVKRTKLRYAQASPVELASADKDLRREWRTDEGGVVIEIRGSRVLIIEGIPDGLNADAAMKALWS